MASKLPDAPVCPACGRSEGIITEAASGWQWRRGAWRPLHEPEYTPDLICTCGHMWSEDD